METPSTACTSPTSLSSITHS
uniref:Uncharacterized protein n=1 Tax=Arundo donax TaxID=35708 RepID=A0A0A8ZSE2_ARUDO